LRALGQPHEGRQDPIIVLSPVEGEHPGGEKAQEGYAPVSGLNRSVMVADSCVEQSLEGEECSVFSAIFSAMQLPSGSMHLHRRSRVYNTVQTNAMMARALETAYGCTGGTKPWRAKPHERIQYEIRLADARWTKAPRGLGKPEGAGGEALGSFSTYAATTHGKTL